MSLRWFQWRTIQEGLEWIINACILNIVKHLGDSIITFFAPKIKVWDLWKSCITLYHPTLLQNSSQVHYPITSAFTCAQTNPKTARVRPKLQKHHQKTLKSFSSSLISPPLSTPIAISIYKIYHCHRFYHRWGHLCLTTTNKNHNEQNHNLFSFLFNRAPRRDGLNESLSPWYLLWSWICNKFRHNNQLGLRFDM